MSGRSAPTNGPFCPCVDIFCLIKLRIDRQGSVLPGWRVAPHPIIWLVAWKMATMTSQGAFSEKCSERRHKEVGVLWKKMLGAVLLFGDNWKKVLAPRKKFKWTGSLLPLCKVGKCLPLVPISTTHNGFKIKRYSYVPYIFDQASRQYTVSAQP